jgi:hypothetical protein
MNKRYKNMCKANEILVNTYKKELNKDYHNHTKNYSNILDLLEKNCEKILDIEKTNMEKRKKRPHHFTKMELKPKKRYKGKDPFDF